MGLSTIGQVAADFSVTSSITLANIPALSANIAPGRTYSFEAYLSCTCAAAGGVRAAIGGTCTATSIIYDGWVRETNAIKGQTNSTALGGLACSSTTIATTGIVIEIRGTITGNAAGTLAIQFAQNTSNATPSVVKRGSYFVIWEQAN